MNNPLFENKPDQRKDYVLPNKKDMVDPSPPRETAGANPAADLVRRKLESIYADEPRVKRELAEAKSAQKRSKHQEFMYALSTSGKSLADIQTEWHNYYLGLPDHEKHEVWQEFYENNTRTSQLAPTHAPQKTIPTKPAHPSRAKRRRTPKTKPTVDPRQPSEIKQQLIDKVSAKGKLKPKHHLQSLAFGLGMGFLTLLIFMFGFFNEVIIAPFIHPNQRASATPLIVGTETEAADKPDEIIIPKINVEIPVDYSQNTTNEATIEQALEDGVVHYPTTELPGQKGNAAFFGHSSGNIFSSGKYKFAFVLLHELRAGDTFYIVKDHKIYSYKVIDRKIVPPTQVSVLDDIPGQVATATLITCDPPGTSLNRLVVVGQQVNPNPVENVTASAKPTKAASASTSLPGNGPNTWQRFIGTVYGKVIVAGVALAAIGLAARRWLLTKPY